MISVEEELIDAVTATFHALRTGKVPPPLPIPEDLPDNELRQLLTYANRFLTEFAPFAEAMKQISQGELDTQPLLGRMPVVQSFSRTFGTSLGRPSRSPLETWSSGWTSWGTSPPPSTA